MERIPVIPMKIQIMKIINIKTMNNRLLILLILLIIGCSGKKMNSKDPCKKIINHFFVMYKNDRNHAIESLLSTNKWITKQSISGINNQIDSSIIDQIGKFQGYEFIVKRSISECMVLYSYIVKYDRQPIRFTFIFYKPREEWIIFKFQFDVELDEELIKSSDIYFLGKTYMSE